MELPSSRSARGQVDAIGASFGTLMDDVVLANSRADHPLFHAEGVRYLTRMFGVAAMRGETDDAAYPRLVPGASLWMNWGFANVDARYQWAQVDGRYNYRFFGNRGTSRIFDIETYEGDFLDMSSLHHCSGARHVQLDRAGPFSRDGDFEVGPDGDFEVVLSAHEQPGNWVRIAEGVGTLFVREYFYDWENEECGRFFIERIGAQYPPPHDTAEDLARRMDCIPEFMDRNARMIAKGIELQHYTLEPNTMRVQPQHSGEAERGQDDQLALRDVHFLQGYYECGPDDAVILEVADIGADYWTYALYSHNWELGDFHFRQTSLNGFQAELDPDGVFRAVISHRDPGVPNWLDPAGRPSGLILGRYLMPGREVAAPTLRVVRFDRLREFLPGSTKVVSPQERSESLRRRMHSVRRRQCDI